ncbi:MAG: META domain-containing protein [Anaerolineaceae bacterium]|nr:META domain-containing protein [Anaerolineaceae bacterium]
MKTRKYIRIAILFVILLSACSGNEPNLEAQLQGKTWVLTSYNDSQPIADRHPTLNFEADQISGTTGCNHYGGTYQIEGDTIRFEGIFSTEMACLEPTGLMEQERIYLDLLRVADQVELNEDVLTFYAESNPIMVFEIQSDEPVTIAPTLEPEKAPEN